ncbi:MAG: hypothetical protein ABL883_14650 [Terricaulis sp.]
MKAAPLRFLRAAFWPLAIWSSLTHLEEHPADDYVERTSPIVATAVAFWLCAAALAVAIWLGLGRVQVFGDGDSDVSARVVPAWTGAASEALWVVTPLLYAIGFWLFTARDEAYPR